MDDGFVALFCALTFIFGCFFGYILMNDLYNQRMKECQKDNNVYKCEMIFIPSEVK